MSATQLQAGVSRAVITPPLGIYLMGYGNRIQGNVGVHDDLYITALVMESADSRAALLAADHTFIHPQFVEQIKSRLHGACAIDPDAVFVCCSHTHSGPIGYADDASRPEDRDYMQFLVEQAVASAVQATARLEPVILRGGTDVAPININRRQRTPDGTIIIGNNPDGPVDHTVQVFQVLSQQGAPLATLVNYACHPVVMGPLNRLVSADWVGVMRREVEASVGGLCLFVQGATGDVNPRKMRWTADNWDEVEEQGAEVAAAVLRACQRATTLEAGAIYARQAVHWLRLMPPGTNDVRSFVPQAQTQEQALAMIRDSFPWYTALERRSDGVYSPMPIGVLRIGDWAMAALATEPFTETGGAIKAASSTKMTFVAGYTNGCNSYLPVSSAYASGGYEVETAPIFYGLPAGFVPGSAEFIANQIISLLSAS